MSRRYGLILSTLALALSCSGAAAAGDPPKKKKDAPAAPPPAPPEDPTVVEAREHFNRAQALYDEGHPDAALLELQRAYAVKPNYRLLFNIGSIAFTTHDYVGSFKAFEQFLKEGGADIDPGKKAEAESRLVTLRALVGKARITVDVEGAAVSVDDEPVGTSPLAASWLVKAGKHRISATKEGYLPGTLAVVVLGGETDTEATLHLAKIVPTTTTVVQQAPVNEPSKFTTLSWVGIGVSVGLAGAAGVLGGLSASARSDLKTIVYAGPTPSQEYKDKQSAANLRGNLAIGFGGASVALLTTTLIATLTSSPKKPAPTTGFKSGLPSVAVGPGSVLVQGVFQ